MNKFITARKEKLSKTQSRDMILKFAMYGDSTLASKGTKIDKIDDLDAYLNKLGIKLSYLIEEARNPNAQIPYLENLLDSSSWVSYSPTSTQQFSIAINYQSLFNKASDDLEISIKNQDFLDLQSSFVFGIASIESFLNFQAENWNTHEINKLLDSKHEKVSFNDKIENWVPVMTRGKKFDKSDEVWKKFIRLRYIRDNYTIHPKTNSFGIDIEDFVSLANDFSHGIAGFLMRLHELFGVLMPRRLIRSVFSPEVILTENPNFIDPIADIERWHKKSE
jgi:hypothetical protein